MAGTGLLWSLHARRVGSSSGAAEDYPDFYTGPEGMRGSCMEVGPMDRPQVILGARRFLQGPGEYLPWNPAEPLPLAPEFKSLHPVLLSGSSSASPAPVPTQGQVRTGLTEGLWHPLQATCLWTFLGYGTATKHPPSPGEGSALGRVSQSGVGPPSGHFLTKAFVEH